MIVPMKKTAIIVQKKDRASAIEALGRMGVLHVEHARLPEGKNISALRDDIELASKAADILSQAGAKIKEKSEQLDGWRFKAKHIIELHNSDLTNVLHL